MPRLFLAFVLFFPTLCHADTVSVDMLFPHPFMAAPEGDGNVSVSVEDQRATAVLGKTVRGNDLLLAGRPSELLREFIVDDLNQAGFMVSEGEGTAPRHLLIRLIELSYRAQKGFIKSEIDVDVTLSVQYQDDGVASVHTFRSHMWQEVALNPSSEENGQVIGQALAAAVRTMYKEGAVRAYLLRNALQQ